MTAYTPTLEVLPERGRQVLEKGKDSFDIACDKASAAGSVSQRACGFCGSRVVLYPISDALHLVHGPVGCAAYTWDIRGALSSGSQLHRLSFTTDMREKDVVYGGEKKLDTALNELIPRYKPKAVFIYATCIVGVIGDDVDAIAKKAEKKHGIPVISVHSEGFKGTKKSGYGAACDALGCLIGTGDTSDLPPFSINILGDFNLAGETWMIRKYYEKMGIHVVSTITGDGRVDDICRAHGAKLNLVQCSGSVTKLAVMMKKKYGIPYKRVSYFGIEDMSKALYEVAEFFGDETVMARTRELVKDEVSRLLPALQRFKADLTGRKVAIYTGGAFKVFSLVRCLQQVGMQTVVAGSQTGSQEDYETLEEICDPGTIIVDDTNPVELSQFIREKDVDLFIGGVKERPIAYKLGVAFCDHNHERKHALAGFEGMFNFIQEVHASVTSPVWKLIPRRRKRSACLDDCSRCSDGC